MEVLCLRALQLIDGRERKGCVYSLNMSVHKVQSLQYESAKPYVRTCVGLTVQHLMSVHYGWNIYAVVLCVSSAHRDYVQIAFHGYSVEGKIQNATNACGGSYDMQNPLKW